MKIWQQIVAWILSAGTITAALVWMAKKLITHFFDRGIEAYRDKLKTESDAMLTVLKDQLQTASAAKLEALKTQLSTTSTAWLEQWKSTLATQSSLLIEEYKIGLSTHSTALVESLKAFLAAESAAQIERLKSNLAIEQQLALRVAEHRQPAYKALWALQERLSPTATTPLTRQVRQELNAALSSWYYQDGNGIVLSLAAGDLFLKAKDLLLADPHQVPDKTLREAFSAVRTQMKEDLSVYDEISASVKIGN
jgi:hypothetical protein